MRSSAPCSTWSPRATWRRRRSASPIGRASPFDPSTSTSPTSRASTPTPLSERTSGYETRPRTSTPLSPWRSASTCSWTIGRPRSRDCCRSIVPCGSWNPIPTTSAQRGWRWRRGRKRASRRSLHWSCGRRPRPLAPRLSPGSTCSPARRPGIACGATGSRPAPLARCSAWGSSPFWAVRCAGRSGAQAGQVRRPERGRSGGTMVARRGFARSRAERTGSTTPQSAPTSGSSHARPSSSAGL